MILDPDVQAFQAAWQIAARHEASAKPDAAILSALDQLAAGVRGRVARGASLETALKPFQAAVAKKDGSTSDPSSLDATLFHDGNRTLIDVRMGYASSLSAFDPSGRRLTLPASLRWSYRNFGDFFRAGSSIVFDGTTLSDAGVRYAYDLQWLRRTGQGYASIGRATGNWNYNSDSPHLTAKGARLTLRSLDEPKSFFTDNATLLLRRQEIWQDGRRRSTTLLDQDVRTADTWLATHRHGEKQLLLSLKRGPNWLDLEFDSNDPDSHLRFTFKNKNLSGPPSRRRD